MGNETKWADVAHYYLKSGIKCNVYRGDLTERRGDCKQTVETFGVKHLRVAADSMTFGCVPILRHLDDMTEADAREIYTIESGNQSTEGNIYHPKMKDWFFNWKKGEVKAKTFYWLISRGFDVFGLIESGQAIRKEVGNG